ncbi:MAG TPA: hypothetical protein VFZ87_07975, partial [Gemmatimonadales bacterium]
MRPPLDLRLPPRGRRPWLAIALSVLLHGWLLFGWVGGREPTVPRRPPQLIVLTPPSEGPEQVPMRYQVPQSAAERSGPELADSRRGTASRRVVRPQLPNPPRPVAALPERRPQRTALDTGSAPRPQPRQPPMLGRIGPGLAQGRLWVRPLPLPPQELAQRLTRSRAQLLDSAVTSIVQAYLDSIANDPASRNQGLPSWTTDIAGRKFGLDSQNIYIAGLKIPAAVLALLPIPAGNIDQNRAYNHLMDIRGDLMYAAQRAQTMEEFKTVIRE